MACISFMLITNNVESLFMNFSVFLFRYFFGGHLSCVSVNGSVCVSAGARGEQSGCQVPWNWNSDSCETLTWARDQTTVAART